MTNPTDEDFLDDEALDEDPEEKVKPKRDWFSGFCGPGPCRDGRTLDEEGNPRHYCLAVSENGMKIRPRYLYCACDCHRSNPSAVQLPLPDNALADN